MYFMGCRKKASFLYLWLPQYESIIPSKAILERRPVFSRASQWFGNLCPNLHSQDVCSHASRCSSTKQATKWVWERFGERMVLFCGIPQRCPRMRPQASLGCWPDPGNSRGWHRGREPMSLGCLRCCYMTPSHWATVSITADTFWLEILPYCERLRWYERNIFIQDPFGGLLGKLWTCWVCRLQVALHQMYFLTFLWLRAKDNKLSSLSAAKKGHHRRFIFCSFLPIKQERYLQGHFSTARAMSTLQKRNGFFSVPGIMPYAYVHWRVTYLRGKKSIRWKFLQWLSFLPYVVPLSICFWVWFI